MKITKQELKQIINEAVKEALRKSDTLNENKSDSGWDFLALDKGSSEKEFMEDFFDIAEKFNRGEDYEIYDTVNKVYILIRNPMRRKVARMAEAYYDWPMGFDLVVAEDYFDGFDGNIVSPDDEMEEEFTEQFYDKNGDLRKDKFVQFLNKLNAKIRLHN